MLSNSQLTSILDTVLEASALARKLNDQGFSSQTKEDNSPVTEVDLQVSGFLCAALNRITPQIALIGEEESYEAFGNRSLQWFLDPIDGTKDLIQGTGDWSIMLGLCAEGRPIWGVVAQPTEDLLWFGGKDQLSGKWNNGKKENLMVKKRSPGQVLTVVDSNNHPDSLVTKFLSLVPTARRSVKGSIGLKLIEIVEGRADLYLNSSKNVKLWDTCAGEAILSSTGGSVMTLDEKNIQYHLRGTRIEKSFFACAAGEKDHLLPILRSL